MRVIITKAAFCVAALLPMGVAHAATIEPYSPKAETFEVDGHEVDSAMATAAFLAGKTIKKCKAMGGANATKTFRIGGKEVKGSEVKTCDVQKLAATKNGTTFKKAK